MIESYKNIYSKLEDIPTKYITAKQLSNLKSLGISTVYDLVYYFLQVREFLRKNGRLRPAWWRLENAKPPILGDLL